jgi:hypothetical protein
MRKNTMRAKNYWAKVVVVTVVLAVSARFGAKWLLYSTNDANFSAYKMMAAGVQSGRFDVMRDNAAAAYRTAQDEDLKKLADLLYRLGDLHVRMGITSVEESSSFSGFAKSFIFGLLNPGGGLLAGVEGVVLQLEIMSFQSKIEQLDAVYQRLLIQEAFAEKAAFWIPLFVLCVVPVFARVFQTQIIRWLNSLESANQESETTP